MRKHDTGLVLELLFRVYYESIKREPKIRGIYECRCDERLQTKMKEFTRLPYTGLVFVYFSGTGTPEKDEEGLFFFRRKGRPDLSRSIP